jgi:hypothetical protein
MPSASLLILAVYLGLIVAAEKSPFSGTWEGKMNDLPGVDLEIETAGGKVSGVIVFYFQLRGDDGKWRVNDKSTDRILTPKVRGKTLAFEVIHYKTHGSSERGPNAKFRMELTGENEAVLHKINDQSAPPLKLTRRR